MGRPTGARSKSTLAFQSRYELLMRRQVERNLAAGTPDAVLTKDRLAEVYGISAVHGHYEDEAYVVPWKSGPPDDFPSERVVWACESASITRTERP